MVDRIVGSEAHEKALVMGAFQNPELTTRNTWGYGLGFHVPRLGGVYFDRGEVALPASALGNHEHTAFGFWINPPGLWRALH